MSPDLAARVAAAVVLICDRRQEPEKVHELLLALVESGHCEGVIEGIERAEAVVDRALERIKA